MHLLVNSKENSIKNEIAGLQRMQKNNFRKDSAQTDSLIMREFEEFYPMKKYVTVNEIFDFFGGAIQKSTIRTWVNNLELESFGKEGKENRIFRNSFREFLLKHINLTKEI